jgi:two-component system LytT family response regulator
MNNQPLQDNPVLIPGYRHFQDTHLMMRLEGDGNYTLIHLSGRSHPLLVSQTLKYFELQLPFFIRASKSSLINPAYIDTVVKQDSKTMHLRLTDGARIPVSRRRIIDTEAKLAA